MMSATQPAPPTGSTACAICGGAQGSTHTVREMMFGTRAGFDYFWCADCGCCQLRTAVDAAAQYPISYPAFQPQPRPTGLIGRLRHLRNLGVFRGNFVGRLLNVVAPYPVSGAHNWFARIPVRSDSRILDVGCGTGELVRDLRASGYVNAEGIDPYLPDGVLALRDGFVKRAWLRDLSGVYDVVMLHHALEHMPDQQDALRHVARLLRPGGHCLVRIPVMPSYAWQRYREHWVQLDAPRHLFVHSERSLAMIGSRVGLTLDLVEYDSTEFQFTGSELYARDLPLTQLHSAYSRRDRQRYRREARRLNKARLGDQAAFYFRRTA